MKRNKVLIRLYRKLIREGIDVNTCRRLLDYYKGENKNEKNTY